MIRLPPRATRTDTLVPYTTLFRSSAFPVVRGAAGRRRRGAAARPVEIILYPRMLGGKQFRDGADRDDLFLRQHRDPVVGRIERVEIGGDEEDGEPHRVARSEENTSELQSLMSSTDDIFRMTKTKS